MFFKSNIYSFTYSENSLNHFSHNFNVLISKDDHFQIKIQSVKKLKKLTKKEEMKGKEKKRETKIFLIVMRNIPDEVEEVEEEVEVQEEEVEVEVVLEGFKVSHDLICRTFIFRWKYFSV